MRKKSANIFSQAERIGTHMLEAPFSPDPRHSIRVQDSGVKLITKPTSPLHYISGFSNHCEMFISHRRRRSNGLAQFCICWFETIKKQLLEKIR